MIRYLLEKEFKQMLRHPFIPKMMIMFPVMVMLLMPWAADFEVRNINVSVVNHDHGSYAQRMVQKVDASDYFRLTNVSSSNSQALNSIESNESDLILEIPPDFEKQLVKEGGAKVMISANAVNSTKGALGSAYLAGILQDFATEIRSEWIQAPAGVSSVPVIEVAPQNRFNPHLNYKVFMVPALMVMLMTMLCGFLPALNIVSEKEVGTIEQLNVSPVSKPTFILAKLIPYWMMGLVVLSLCFGLAALIYGVIPAGSLWTIYFFAAIYILVVSGLGLIISNNCSTMQQAMFLMFFFMIIMLLISGLFTPISSMPQWAQWLTTINPLKYFIQVMRMVYLKGAGIGALTTQLIALSCFAIIFNTWAVLSYRKSR